MAERTHEAPVSGPRLSKRRLGYLIWAVGAAVIGIPELTAAAGSSLPFTTISTMTGHLERHHSWVELIVVAGLVFGVYSLVRVPPRTRSGASAEGAAAAPAPGEPVRTPGGRLLAHRPPASDSSAAEFDNDPASLFAVVVAVALTGVALGTWTAVKWWPDPAHKPHFHPAYVLYGSLGLLFVVIPSTLASLAGTDAPFPTLFRTVFNLEDWLRARPWPRSLGPLLAWLVSYVIYAGLAILLLHLTLYPYPDITKVLNPNG